MIQMSDIHYDPMLRPEYFDQAIEIVLALKPDLIVLTGTLSPGENSCPPRSAS
jgi:predicted MPP superfamily phosphohydrolase